MAFRQLGDNRPRQAVSGAAMALAGPLQLSGRADVEVLRIPRIESRKAAPDFGERAIVILHSLYDSFFRQSIREVETLKREYPRGWVVMGGPGVNTATSMKTLGSFFQGSVVFYKGDGEKDIIELVEILAGEKPDQSFSVSAKTRLSELHGIYVRHMDFEYQNEQLNILSPEEAANVIIEMTMPELSKDVQQTGMLRLITGRGCTNHCVFCSHKYHVKVVGWSPERIIAELWQITNLISAGMLPQAARNLSLSDDNFLLDRPRAKAFLRLLCANKQLRNYFKLSYQGSVDVFYEKGELDTELLDLLAAAKASPLFIGTDGFHPKALKALRKPYSWKQVLDLVEALDQRKIKQFHYGILTYRDLDPETFYETALNIFGLLTKFPKTITIDPQLYLRAYENTPLASQLAKEGFQLRAMVAPDGALKKLPTRVPIRDRNLEKVLYDAASFRVGKDNFDDLMGADMIMRLGRRRIRTFKQQFVTLALKKAKTRSVASLLSHGNNLFMSHALGYIMERFLEFYVEKPAEKDSPT